MTNSTGGRTYLKVPDVAKMFGVNPRTVWDWVYRGLIPHRRLGRNVFFTEADIQIQMDENRFMGRQKVPAVSAGDLPVYRGCQSLPRHLLVETEKGLKPAQMSFDGDFVPEWEKFYLERQKRHRLVNVGRDTKP